MTRARSLSYLLWSILATGCGDDKDRVGGLADAPPAPDAASPDAASPDAASPDAASPDAPGGPAFSLGTLPTLSTTCGVSEPEPVVLTIMNTGGAALVINTAEATGGFAVVTTLPLTIPAGDTAAVEVRPPVAVIGTDRGGTTKAGTLTLTTNEIAQAAHTVELAATVMGANLEFTDESNEPIRVDFSTSDGSCPAPLSMFLRNTGNLPIALSGPSGNSTSTASLNFGGFSGGTIGPGSSVSQRLEVHTTGACSGSDSAGVSYRVIDSNVCTTATSISAQFTIRGDEDGICTCPDPG